MTIDLIEKTLELLNKKEYGIDVKCPLCTWDNSINSPREGMIIACGGCYLDIKIKKINPLQIEPMSEWYHFYNGGA